MLICDNETRRDDVRQKGFHGLDYVEVSDCQTILRVYFLGKIPAALSSLPLSQLQKQVLIAGGRRPGYLAPADIQIDDVSFGIAADEEIDDCMIVKVNKPGDFSTYRLSLVDAGDPGDPFDGFDERYHSLDFTFKAGCPSDLDCKPREVCPPEQVIQPDINYLAKDYHSFRQLILDRLALLMPQWTDRLEADIGIALVELLAYVGDHLSYHQDAVATEAYLGTARQRISVRRHAQLVDYQLNEGCNSRAWVFVELQQAVSTTLDVNDFYLITHYRNGPQSGVSLNEKDLPEDVKDKYLVFEPCLPPSTHRESEDQTITLYKAHNEIEIYTWGDTECCLAKGATSVSLKDEWTGATTTQQQGYAPQERLMNLKVGDLLLFEEMIGPRTGNGSDADPAHRQVVRLTSVTELVDDLYDQPVVEVQWSEVDALRFPLCVSTMGPAPECELLCNVSIARGNIILADHGRTIPNEPLACVPTERTEVECVEVGRSGDLRAFAGKFAPQLENHPLTFAVPIDTDASARAIVDYDPRDAIPEVQLHSTPASRDGRTLCSPDDVDHPCDELIIQLRVCDEYLAKCLFATFSIEIRRLLAARTADDPITADEKMQVATQLDQLCTIWQARQSLLNSRGNDPHFVAEIDNHSQVHLRFGDGELGLQPAAGAEFRARYRVGSGTAGNVGAEAIRHVVFRDGHAGNVKLLPRNPLPATGGVDPETLTEAKQFAPFAFRRVLKRAITADDYAQIVQRDFATHVQRAFATLQWAGSFYEVLVAVDAFDRFRDPPRLTDLLQEIQTHLNNYRRIGHDVRVGAALQVPLDIVMTVCVEVDYLPGEVKDVLLNRFSSRVNADGSLGYFHPDNLTFGQDIRLSKLVAIARNVTGVENVKVERFQRLFDGPGDGIATGILPMGPMEIARLDNDPNFRENGKLQFNMRGGR